ncbi:acetylcholinesterase-1-like [Macrobrachium nipponense]|uniref:acetylcholinesterase-1-like n=1 Tax=Macrobrachium nipponense TaxID=159736 RepID=UPI0030C7CAB2
MHSRWLQYTILFQIIYVTLTIRPALSTSHRDIEQSKPPGIDPPSTTLRNGFMGSTQPVLATYNEMKTLKGRPVYAFLGLKYGQNTAGRKRFKKSTMYTLQTSTLNATSYGKKCPQMRNKEYDLDSSEDCLLLNVYTFIKPTEATTGSIPVMVFSHGGDGVTGDSSEYKPDVLLDYNVILVTFQYRLGTLGTFTMNSKDAPGNVMLWDHILALQWVQQNIKFLGGDPNSVTVFGQGFGAVLTSFLLLSKNGTSVIPPVSQQLFQAMILESGSFLQRYSFGDGQNGAYKKIATINNCYNRYPQYVLPCMMAKPAHELAMNLQAYMVSERRAGRSGYDNNRLLVQNGTGISSADILLKDYPENTIKDISKLVNIPIMVGANKHEGSYHFASMYWTLLKGKYDDADYIKNKMLQDIIRMSGLPGPNNDLVEALRNDYLGDIDMSSLQAATSGLIDLTGNIMAKLPVWRIAQVMAKVNKAYFYAFDFPSKDSLFDTYFTCEDPDPIFDHGVTHGDELMYLFNKPEGLQLDEGQNRTRDRLATLWTNFAIYHDPTPDADASPWKDLGIPKWAPIGTDKNYLLIEEDCKIETDYMKRRHIARVPVPLPTQEEYDFVNSQRGAFMACMIVFLLTSIILGILVFLKYSSMGRG